MPQPDTSLHYHSTNTGLVDCAVRLFTKVNKAKGRPGWISLYTKKRWFTLPTTSVNHLLQCDQVQHTMTTLT